MAGGVHQARSVLVQRAVSPVVGEVVGGDASPDDAQPPSLPLGRRLRRLIRGKQVVPAERTASVLLGEQAQVIAIQRGFHLAPPRGPVVDQIGVIWGCPARDYLVSNDGRPGELDQIGDVPAIIHRTVTGTKYPPVIPELVEPAEVAAGNPLLRLVGVAVAGPPVGQPPHILIQR